MTKLHLTQARAELTHTITALNESFEAVTVSVPAERALTIYVDKREIVTLMTLGVNPELLTLGYLLNQKLIASPAEVASITVDWCATEEGGAAAVKTHSGLVAIEQRTAHRIVTTGCGQGSSFGGLLDAAQQLRLPDAQLPQAALFEMLSLIRLQDTTYKQAGSVHGCALFRIDARRKSAQLLYHVEDVGRHNALDTLAGWMSLQALQDKGCSDAPRAGHTGCALYTTGRLTSEMVLKSVQMGVPFVVSRSGMTQMGYELASKLNLCLIGRALHTRYLCYTGGEKITP